METISAASGEEPRDVLVDNWQELAACRDGADPEKFFPTEEKDLAEGAKLTCGGCAVRAECLEYAVAHDERFGVWGGQTELERRRGSQKVA